MVFIPLSDDNPLRSISFQWVNVALIVANVVAFFLQNSQGAQASIYQRAKVALDQSLPLLDGLYSLLPDSDPEDTGAIRAIIRFELSELVSELGVEGGPRVQRVDELFASLLGDDPDLTDPEQVGGQLNLLRERLGLERFEDPLREERFGAIRVVSQ